MLITILFGNNKGLTAADQPFHAKNGPLSFSELKVSDIFINPSLPMQTI